MENQVTPGASLAAMRKTETKICPEKDCGTVFTALVRASSTCKKCRDRLRKQARRIASLVGALPVGVVLVLVTPASKEKPHVEAWDRDRKMTIRISTKLLSSLLNAGVVSKKLSSDNASELDVIRDYYVLSAELSLPDKPGVWLHQSSGKMLDVYPLEPAGGELCIWGPDAGITYSGAVDTQGCWSSDEWQGHVPVRLFDAAGPWLYVKP